MTDREKVIVEIEDALSGNLAKAGHVYKLSLNGLKDKALTDALELLKEQEAVKPEWRKGTPFCGNCGHRLEKKNRNMDGCKCPSCERLVKWK